MVHRRHLPTFCVTLPGSYSIMASSTSLVMGRPNTLTAMVVAAAPLAEFHGACRRLSRARAGPWACRLKRNSGERQFKVTVVVAEYSCRLPPESCWRASWGAASKRSTRTLRGLFASTPHRRLFVLILRRVYTYTIRRGWQERQRWRVTSVASVPIDPIRVYGRQPANSYRRCKACSSRFLASSPLFRFTTMAVDGPCAVLPVPPPPSSLVDLTDAELRVLARKVAIGEQRSVMENPISTVQDRIDLLTHLKECLRTAAKILDLGEAADVAGDRKAAATAALHRYCNVSVGVALQTTRNPSLRLDYLTQVGRSGRVEREGRATPSLPVRLRLMMPAKRAHPSATLRVRGPHRRCSSWRQVHPMPHAKTSLWAQSLFLPLLTQFSAAACTRLALCTSDHRPQQMQ